MDQIPVEVARIVIDIMQVFVKDLDTTDPEVSIVFDNLKKSNVQRGIHPDRVSVSTLLKVLYGMGYTTNSFLSANHYTGGVIELVKPIFEERDGNGGNW